MPSQNKKKIAIFNKNFIQVVPYGSHTYYKHMKSWKLNDIVRDEPLIEELVKLGAPIEIYEKC